MALSSLTLTAFRSYDALRLALAPGVGVLTGPNGAGKTNVLEAISLFAPGRGLRGAKVGEFQKVGAPSPWAVVAEQADGTRLGTGQDPDAGDVARRVAVVEGERTSPHSFLPHIALSWLTPAMDRLWTESPSARRRFLDRLTGALDPAHTTHLNRYEEALAERNRLLREEKFDDGWLTGLEHVMATEGVAVAAARRELVRGLTEVLARPLDLFPAPVLVLDGVESGLEATPALLLEDRLRADLARARRLDAATGMTSIGPHRTDLQALHPDKGLPAALGSTGEQKALVISLILAHAALIRRARGLSPVLLLDEVGAHLDEARRASLFARLQASGSQVLMTGADTSLFAPLPKPFLCYHMPTGRVVGNVPDPVF